jgi:hypothetical protein
MQLLTFMITSLLLPALSHGIRRINARRWETFLPRPGRLIACRSAVVEIDPTRTVEFEIFAAASGTDGVNGH